MNYRTAYNLLKEYGIIFLLAIDPESEPYVYKAYFSYLGAAEGSDVHIPEPARTMRSSTAPIDPDAFAQEIWEELKKYHIVILQIGFNARALQIQTDNTICEVTPTK